MHHKPMVKNYQGFSFITQWIENKHNKTAIDLQDCTATEINFLLVRTTNHCFKLKLITMISEVSNLTNLQVREPYKTNH